MKKIRMNKFLRLLLATLFAVTFVFTAKPMTQFAMADMSADMEGELDFDSSAIVILYTNDVHNVYLQTTDSKTGAITNNGYAALAYAKNTFLETTPNVALVDNGDAIQGALIGALSRGEDVVKIMNKVGYDFAIPGNHEFDFGMDRFLALAGKDSTFDGTKSSYKYLSCNFMDLKTNKNVLDAYDIKTFNVSGEEVKVAFIGISTPETITKSTPVYFQNAAGEFIYGFSSGNNGQNLYDKVQAAVDAAKAAGAKYVVALAHTGVDPDSAPYDSESIIAHTSGIDIYLDGHSHVVIEGQKVKNKENKDVLLSSTGTKLATVGQVVISSTGDINSTLISKITKEDTEAKAFVKDIQDKYKEITSRKVAEAQVDLVVNDPVTGKRMVRSQETNMADLCADAYKDQLGADCAIVNGGGVRDKIATGDVTYENIINVHPFGNMACLAEVTGQMILDCLEMGSKAATADNTESGGFIHVSGITYDIDTTIPSTVEVDEKGVFIEVAGKRRVKNVKINGEAINPSKTYKLASHNYMLKNGGDGMSMYRGCRIILDEVYADNEVLINYITKTLGGTIPANSIYDNPYGEGRIRVLVSVDENVEKYLKGFETYDVAHVWDDGKETKKATYKEKGEKLYTCTSCGKTKTEETPVVPHEHKYATTITQATTTKAGSKVTKCTLCDDVKKTVVINPASNITLEKTAYTFDGEVKTPVVTVKDSKKNTISKSNYTISYSKGRKSIGSYNVKITFKGDYKGSTKLAFVINPKGTRLSKVTASSKAFTANWKKQDVETSGYQLQYSTSAKFDKNVKSVTVKKNDATSKTIKQLSAKKKYYVRIRTYKTVGKDNFYSSWSKALEVTTKK